jgi:glucose-6-phosphate isomerase, archaeal
MGDLAMLDIAMDWSNARFSGKKVGTSRRTLADIENYFLDQSAVKQTRPDTLVYEVQSYEPLPEGTGGGLFWGNTTLYPGRIGDEYFMTKGHFHHIRNRGEFYVTRQGQGALLLMEEGGPTVAETMSSGSVHYIPGHHAHRVANTGTEPLIFIACWPSDAGYDYAAIERNGFSARLLERNGVPTLVPQR